MLTDDYVRFGGGFRDDVEAVVVAFHDLDLWIPFLKVGWNVAKHGCNFIIRMSIDDRVKHCAANVAGGSCAATMVNRLDSS